MIQIVENNIDLCPSILYKYRDWDNPIHRTVIEKRQLFLSPPNAFEDEYDCNPIIHPLTRDELYELFHSYSLKHNPHFSHEQHIAYIVRCIENSPMSDSNKFKQELDRLRAEFSNRFGVLCLTEDCNNDLMWDRYAKGSTGICVGISGEALGKMVGGGGSVTYVPTIPSYKFQTLSSDKEIEITIMHKHNVWEFEKEYRLTKMCGTFFESKDRIITVCPEDIKVVIIGSKMNLDKKAKLQQYIKDNLPYTIIKFQ